MLVQKKYRFDCPCSPKHENPFILSTTNLENQKDTLKTFRTYKAASCIFIVLMCIGCNQNPAPSISKQPHKDIVILDTPLTELSTNNVPVESSKTSLPHVPLPDGFVDLGEFIPNLKIELRYFSSDNFIGDTVTGYLANRAILSLEAAQALVEVQSELEESGMGLKLYDAYRPQQAVDHFIAWSRDLDDTLTKSDYYPRLVKYQLFQLGYIARQSSHSRGSAVDVTIVYQHPDSLGKGIDMGSSWDLFDEASHTVSSKVNPLQSGNREMLRKVMVKHGFRSLPIEWWHFRLYPEPYPETYFNFDIK
jgi:D-alanyl-D-alanine dipeptidase